MFTIT